MLRIGVTQRVQVLVDRDERRDVLDQAWTELLGERGWWVVPIPNRIPDATRFLSDLAIDAVVLTGGNDLEAAPGGTDVAPERDALERQLFRACAERDLPLLGVCRGLQHMVVHYGGRLTRVDGHVGHPHPVHARGNVLPFCERARVNTFHDFGVTEADLPSELRVAAVAPDGSVEAIAHTSHRQWALLWHPERRPRDERDLDLMATLFGERA